MPMVRIVYDLNGIGVVQVGNDGVRGEQCEFAEGFLQVLHGLEEFQMVRVHVQEHRDIGHQMQEGVAVFACLHHDLAPCAVAAVGVDERMTAAGSA